MSTSMQNFSHVRIPHSETVQLWTITLIIFIITQICTVVTYKCVMWKSSVYLNKYQVCICEGLYPVERKQFYNICTCKYWIDIAIEHNSQLHQSVCVMAWPIYKLYAPLPIFFLILESLLCFVMGWKHTKTSDSAQCMVVVVEFTCTVFPWNLAAPWNPTALKKMSPHISANSSQ